MFQITAIPCSFPCSPREMAISRRQMKPALVLSKYLSTQDSLQGIFHLAASPAYTFLLIWEAHPTFPLRILIVKYLIYHGSVEDKHFSMISSRYICSLSSPAPPHYSSLAELQFGETNTRDMTVHSPLCSLGSEYSDCGLSLVWLQGELALVQFVLLLRWRTMAHRNHRANLCCMEPPL